MLGQLVRAFAPTGEVVLNVEATPERIVGWFVHRWQLENTFRESRAHLGLETQRQWNKAAIARTTPVVFALFSLVTLMAHALQTPRPSQQERRPSQQERRPSQQERRPSQQERRPGVVMAQKAAWYDKHPPTFSDALALVRRHLEGALEGSRSEAHRMFDRIFDLSWCESDRRQYQTAVIRLLKQALDYAG